MGKVEDIAFGAINAFGFISGSPYSHCPICGKRIYGSLDFTNKDNPTFMYPALRKTIGRIPVVGGKASRFIAERLYDPTYSFYCNKCDYEWVRSYKDVK